MGGSPVAAMFALLLAGVSATTPVTVGGSAWSITCSDGTQFASDTTGAFNAAVGSSCTLSFNVDSATRVTLANMPPSPPHPPMPPAPPAPLSPPPPLGSCYVQGQDYKVDGCGYADTLSIIDNRTDTDASSWFNGPRSVVIDLAHPSQCQALCANFTGCDFFSFEIQQSLPEAKCYLKRAYSDPSCVGYSEPRE